MSIVATVFIPEGIIMSADSRLTGTTKHNDSGIIDRHTLSDNSQKIFLIKDNLIGISCCGNATISGKSVGDFIRSFEIEKVEKQDDVCSIAIKLKDYTMSNHGDGVIYHVCGYLNDVQYIYVIINKEITRINIDSNEKTVWAATWHGEQDILQKLLLGDNHLQFDWNFMQLKDGIDLAEFMVDLTCKTQRFTSGLATCGGAIDILVITKDYTKWIKHKVLNP
ncbi:hypothetical protein [Clostridium pasteurianum]|uniref:Uncharacterized protein n=1 Tax=Clostridium pasteurianum BC1 TaxID=86416 RepID=R4KAZ6_CLOPA|nr:hypothetical protein [Clostridium pasteurianum]AGK97694.1 hypothetical protein Clopa_2856 [Clostridium pasteurianum BC1]